MPTLLTLALASVVSLAEASPQSDTGAADHGSPTPAATTASGGGRPSASTRPSARGDVPAPETRAPGAAVTTGLAVAASAFGISFTALFFEDSRARAVEALRDPLYIQFFDDDIALLGFGAASNASGFALSAVAGHLWARRDLTLGRVDRRRAVALMTAGTIALAAGLGMHIAGFLAPNPCHANPDAADASIACINANAHRSIALTSVGALAAHVGVGSLAYGGTLLNAQPSFTASRHGATLGLQLAF